MASPPLQKRRREASLRPFAQTGCSRNDVEKSTRGTTTNHPELSDSMKNLIGSGGNMASPQGDPISELRSRRRRARFGGGRKALEAIRATGRGLHGQNRSSSRPGFLCRS